MRVIVVGSGLAAVGAIRALLKVGHRPVVLDIGAQLPVQLVEHRTRMAQRPPAEWTSAEWKQLGKNEGLPGRVVPRKLVFGSDYFYSTEQADIKKMDEYFAGTPPWSPARGGFSTGWGAAVLPPAPTDLTDWPITHDDLLRNMHEVLVGVPVSEPDDELGRVFGRLQPNGGDVLEMSEGQANLLNRLKQASQTDADATVLVGQSRLLTQAGSTATNRCRFCGHCSSGCVYDSIYTAEHDIDRWVREDRIDYRSGVTVFKVLEQAGSVRAHYRVGDEVKSLECDRLFLAAGAVNSARILLNSSKAGIDSVIIRRTGYSVQVYSSFRGIDVEWPNVNTQTSHFLTFRDLRLSPFWAHAQIGQPNELMLRRLGMTYAGGRVRNILAKRAASRLVSVALNLHSSLGPTYEVRIQPNSERLPSPATRQTWPSESRRSINVHVRALRRLLKPTGFFAVPLARQNSAAALTYHFGASFPMQKNPQNPFDTDVIGRPFGWQRVHVVDTSVLPAIPATTVGLLTMANAHRIAAYAVATD